MTTIASSLDSLGRELRHAVRGALRRPAYTLAAVLTLALGLGATTAIFSVVNTVLLKPLPYPNAERLVAISHVARNQGDGRIDVVSSMYLTYRKESRTLRNIGLYGNGGQSVTGVGEPEQARALFVTHEVLLALGVQPALGRLFTEADDTPPIQGADPIIITYGYWQRKFGGDPDVIGRAMTVDARPSQVVGVMPAGFRFLDMAPDAEIILTIKTAPLGAVLGNSAFAAQRALAELAPGATIEQANADVARMLPIWLDSWPASPGGVDRATIESWGLVPGVHALKGDVIGDVGKVLWLLMGTIGAVLLIACANIANLMLVRADARRPEIAIRAALGAPRVRLVRELFVESLVIGTAGGVLGLALARASLALLVALGPTSLPRLQEIAIDPLVLAFAVGATLASSVFFGSFPALKYTRRVDSLGGGARGATAGRETHRTRSTLVAAQVALALALVVSSGLMIRTFAALRDVDPGFAEPERIQVARIWAAPLGRPDPKDYTRLERDILEKIQALPGVTSAAFGFGVPMEGRLFSSPLFAEDKPVVVGKAMPSRRIKVVSPGWFATLGTRMVAGRDITWNDIDDGGKVAVLSENLARELWSSPQAALGKRVRDTEPAAPGEWREVVGVVQDVHESNLNEPAQAIVYLPVLMDGYGGNAVFGTPAIAYAIRTERAGTAAFVNEVKQAVWSVNGNLPVFLVRTLQDLYAGTLANAAFTLVMLAIAGAMALGLGVVGIAGVMAYVVSQRTREIGIRVALGAQPGRVERMLLRQGLGMAAIGAAAGLVIAAGAARFMRSVLYGVGPLDLTTYAAALAVILCAAAIAS
ncbi:MAG TPA: ABC transporter permease, partial [Gammaproteobacteria bacterium]|nr:ABC transporter permease [Gammaproteobacteria bacterium]